MGVREEREMWDRRRESRGRRRERWVEEAGVWGDRGREKVEERVEQVVYSYYCEFGWEMPPIFFDHHHF